MFSVVFYFFMSMFMLKIFSSKINLLNLVCLYFLVLRLVPIKMDYLQEVSFFLGVSLSGYFLVVLSLLVLMVIFVSQVNRESSMKQFKDFFFLNYMIIGFCLLSFFVLKMFFFYVFFELSLIPMFLIIMGWGYQPERIKAGLMMFFYTLVASLPFLVVLIVMSSWGLEYFDQISFCILKTQCNSFFGNMFLFFMFLGFLVKLPMFLLHLWLPQAHVEAPVSGSMVLAAILLKLGGYGMIRLSDFFHHDSFVCRVFFVVGLFGGALASFSCIQQVDMKVIVAYSSVAHMGMLVASVMVGSSWGILSAMMILLGHGFVSSGLFYGVNWVYEFSGSRSVLLNKGVLLASPVFSLVWGLLCVANMGGPPSFNLVGEVLSCMSMIFFSTVAMLGVFLFLVFSVFYNLNLYSVLNHGVSVNKKVILGKMSCQEGLVYFFHLGAVFLSPLLLFLFSKF